MDRAVEEFLARMTAMFGPPSGDDTGLAALEIAKALAPFGPEIISAACDRIMVSRTKRTWPLPAEIVAECEAQKAAADYAKRKQAEDRKRDPWSEEAIAEARELLKEPLGARAARECWIGQFWDFCRVHGRLPEGLEISRLQKSAQGQRRVRNEMADGLKGPFARSLVKLAASFDRHERKLVDIALDAERDRNGAGFVSHAG